jgi:protein-S-isoprenylcysteine O-methyltransferase Ste14
VGLGAILGRWRRLAALAAGYPLVLLTCHQGVTRSPDGSALMAIFAFVGLVLLVPLLGWVLLQTLLLNPPWWAASALVLTAGLVAVALLDGHRATRRRITAARPADGPSSASSAPGPAR